MDPITIATAVASVIKIAVDLGPTVITGIEDAQPFAQEIMNLFEGQNVTQDQLDAMLANIQSQSAQLQAVKTS